MPSGARANNIGTLRLAGAFAVLFGHSFVLSSPSGQDRDPVSEAIADVAPLNFGLPLLGVAMFFAISGYLVAQSFVRRGSALAYTEARLLRIYPALWLAIGLTLVVATFISTFPPGDFATGRQTVSYAVGGASLLDLSYLLPGVFTDNPRASVNGSLWTLPVELKMYLFVGMAGLLGLLRRRAPFNVAAAAIVASALLWPAGFPLMSNPEHREIAIFFVAGATLFVNRDLLPLRAAGVAGLGVLAAALSPTAAYPLAFALAFSYAVLWLGFTDRIRLPDLAARGDLSYGTYLYAFPVTQLWVSALGPGSPLVIAALTLATTLPLAFASWNAVEGPALRLKGRLIPWLRRRRAAAGGGAAVPGSDRSN